MGSSFDDHFSDRAEGYARYRPGYPPELFEYLAAIVPHRERAWDCGTGNGQAAVSLASHFRSVLATDASRRQIATRRRHERVHYTVAAAESAPLNCSTMDLLAAAQALHWFDITAFFDEARRVVRPGGAVAVWCYSLPRIEAPIDQVIERYYRDVVGPYWLENRQLVNTAYRTVPFPFEELEPPPFATQQDYDLASLVGYMDTWSASRRYRLARGHDPLDAIREPLAAAWGEPTHRRQVTWPLHVRVGRVR